MNYQQIIESVGGKFLGVESGFVWLDAPSHSTLVIKESEFSAEQVRAKLAEDAGKDWNYAKETDAKVYVAD